MQVSVGVQEQIPITSFEDWVHHPKITHHFHWVGLPHGGINQWDVVVLWLEDSGEQPIIVLSPVGQDEVAPGIVGALFGFIIVILQGGMAYSATQAHPCWIVAGVKMIRFHISYVAGGVYQAVRRVCGDGHSTPKVADKKTKGAPLAGTTSGLESITRCLKVDLYVLDKV